MGAPERLVPDGFLLVEHGYDQQAMIKGLFESAGLIDIQAVADSSHQPRAVLGFKSPE
jgi:release factor glutamine methyltransferase